MRTSERVTDMSTIYEWNKYLDVVQELALIEDDLRDTAANGNQRASAFAQTLLFERFGVLHARGGVDVLG
jgi:hypothetical protein